MSASSGSSRISSRSSISIRVTSTPRRERDCASSTPIAPPPTIARDAGRSVRSNASAWVKYPTSSRPGMGGTAARVPVAITNRRAVMRRPSTSTSCGETNLASPSTTSTPMPRKRSGSSCGAMRARTSRTLSSTAPASIGVGRLARPKRSLSRIPFASRAELINAFDGTQPVQRQSPPSRSRSISAARAPRPATPAAVTSPAVPPPIATTSNSGLLLTRSLRLSSQRGHARRSSPRANGTTGRVLAFPDGRHPASVRPVPVDPRRSLR